MKLKAFFWMGLSHVGQVQILRISPKKNPIWTFKNDLYLPVQNDLGGPKSFWPIEGQVNSHFWISIQHLFPSF